MGKCLRFISLRAVDSVTKRDGESYKNFVLRAGRDPLARQVILADLENNCDLTRIVSPKAADHVRIEKCRNEIKQFREQTRSV